MEYLECAFMAAVVGSLLFIQFQLHEIGKKLEPKDRSGNSRCQKPADGLNHINGSGLGDGEGCCLLYRKRDFARLVKDMTDEAAGSRDDEAPPVG